MNSLRETLKTKIKEELPKMYLSGRIPFRTALRRFSLRNQQFSSGSVRRFLMRDNNNVIGFPKTPDDIESFVRYTYGDVDKEDRAFCHKSFINVLSDCVYEEFKNEVNVKKFSRKNHRK